MTTLFRCFSLFPLWLLHALGWVMGWLAFCCSATYRRRLREHVRQAGYSLWQLRAAIGHAGCMVAELPRLWLGAPVPVRWADLAPIEQAYARGRGVLFLTPHLGAFEVAAQVAASEFSSRYGPVTVLYRPARQPWLARLIAASRQRPGLQTAPTTLAGVRQMIKALRRGQAVGLLPDQVPPQGQGVWVPFFGRPAYTMTLAVRLAQQTGAALVLARCERLPWGRGFLLHAQPLATELAEDLSTAVAQLNLEMERVIRDRPEQYLWGYGRYKQPRQESAPAPASTRAGPEEIL